jgi:hypothetical protein
MAQTRRKRQTKHRGNAAGVVEARGRTGRKPTAAEKSGKAGEAARAKQKRLEKYDRPPTWRGAFWRALAAAVVMVALSLLLFAKKNPAEAFALFPIVLLLYIPISYYTDQWLFKRRQRGKAGRAGGKAAPR